MNRIFMNLEMTLTQLFLPCPKDIYMYMPFIVKQVYWYMIGPLVFISTHFFPGSPCSVLKYNVYIMVPRTLICICL